ncbi:MULTISPECIES: DUF4012 domain-containing protein [Nocardioides]|uniref:DUF4012 domain-containing protein n=1 Tax=Nocardioides vastitatis TaxID=2568655 RepID=A0ABW0ZG11_9ACTN|nr:DUF4012 domain-containing protein [Nocardioides sp.]THJ02317.1 DUF4012 domain-containing protein [Nocardioides sp.]
MLQSRAFRISVAGVALLVLILGVWVAWQVSQVNKALSDAVHHAEVIQAALDDGDTDALDRELPRLREASGDATHRTSGVTWGMLTKLPVFGDDAEGVRVTSVVIDDLANDGVQPLAEVADRLDDLLPRGGSIDTALARELAEPVAQAEAAFSDAEAKLYAQDPSSFIGRLSTRFTDFRDQVSKASDAMGSAKVATAVLPAMIGDEGPRRYVLVFQNNAEIRGTGGLAGAASYIEADGGRLAIKRHVPGASLGEAPAPVLPLDDAERELYGDVLGTYFVNAGMTPDVPRAAELIKARWKQEFPTDPVDGVLMIDAVAIGYLLDATGPVTVDGLELTSDNVVDELLHKSYLRLKDPRAQDAFFAEVASAAFDGFTNGVDDSVGLVRAMARATDERRVYVHSFDAALQSDLSGTAIAGDFVADPAVEEPQIAVTLNDTTGAKMSYFLRYEVGVNATSCVDGVQTFSAKARLHSTAPENAADLPDYVTGGGQFGVEPGSQLLTLRIFGPAGGALGELEWNGAPMDLIRVDEDSRPVGMTYVGLEPGQTVDLAWTMRSGEGQTGDTSVAVTPTIQKTDNARTLNSACHAEGN